MSARVFLTRHADASRIKFDFYLRDPQRGISTPLGNVRIGMAQPQLQALRSRAARGLRYDAASLVHMSLSDPDVGFNRPGLDWIRFWPLSGAVSRRPQDPDGVREDFNATLEAWTRLLNRLRKEGGPAGSPFGPIVRLLAGPLLGLSAYAWGMDPSAAFLAVLFPLGTPSAAGALLPPAPGEDLDPAEQSALDRLSQIMPQVRLVVEAGRAKGPSPRVRWTPSRKRLYITRGTEPLRASDVLMALPPEFLAAWRPERRALEEIFRQVQDGVYRSDGERFDLSVTSLSRADRSGLLQRILRLGQGRKVLSVGSGLGHIEASLRALQLDITAVERFTPFAQETRQRGTPTVIGDGHRNGFRSRSFGLVYLSESIGYFSLPEAFAEFYRLLEPGGHLILTTYPETLSPDKTLYKPFHDASLIQKYLWKAGFADVHLDPLARARGKLICVTARKPAPEQLAPGPLHPSLQKAGGYVNGRPLDRLEPEHLQAIRRQAERRLRGKSVQGFNLLLKTRALRGEADAVQASTVHRFAAAESGWEAVLPAGWEESIGLPGGLLVQALGRAAEASSFRPRVVLSVRHISEKGTDRLAGRAGDILFLHHSLPELAADLETRLPGAAGVFLQAVLEDALSPEPVEPGDRRLDAMLRGRALSRIRALASEAGLDLNLFGQILRQRGALDSVDWTDPARLDAPPDPARSRPAAPLPPGLLREAEELLREAEAALRDGRANDAQEIYEYVVFKLEDFGGRPRVRRLIEKARREAARLDGASGIGGRLSGGLKGALLGLLMAVILWTAPDRRASHPAALDAAA